MGEKDASIKLTAREDFARRCLNAAVNLYGIVTMDEFVSLYNGYAKNHAVPVSDPMTVSELNELVDRLLTLSIPEDASAEAILDEPDVLFSMWQAKTGEPRVIVYYGLVAADPSDDRFEAEKVREIDDGIRAVFASFRKLDLAVLPEDVFLGYENLIFDEVTKASRVFEKFIRKEYRLEKDEAEIDTRDIQTKMRFNGATILKIVLTHLGLPTECPVRLGVSDQARFAAETIRRIYANGNFDSVVLGKENA